MFAHVERFPNPQKKFSHFHLRKNLDSAGPLKKTWEVIKWNFCLSNSRGPIRFLAYSLARYNRLKLPVKTRGDISLASCGVLTKFCQNQWRVKQKQLFHQKSWQKASNSDKTGATEALKLILLAAACMPKVFTGPKIQTRTQWDSEMD